MYTFPITGHKNICATHLTTIEFTATKEVTTAGDCIAGVNGVFDREKITRELAYPKIEITIDAARKHFSFYATPHKQFSDEEEMVFRKGDFLSQRTVATCASRAACDIPREIVRALQRGETGKVTIRGVPLQFLLFDFDDTLCDFHAAREHCHEKISALLAKTYHVSEKRCRELLDAADLQFPKKASATNNVTLFDRHKWFAWIAEKIQKKLSPSECKNWVKKYWDCMIEKTMVFAGAAEMLQKFSHKYTLGLITDADGKKEYKQIRIEKSGLQKFFTAMSLGDELQVVKPYPIIFQDILHKLHAAPEQCVMVGDKPWADLLPAKKMGMMTIWVKRGVYAKQVKDMPKYVDYSITDVKELNALL